MEESKIDSNEATSLLCYVSFAFELIQTCICFVIFLFTVALFPAPSVFFWVTR